MSYPGTLRRVVEARTRRPQAEIRAVRIVFEPGGRHEEIGFMRAYAEADVLIDGIEQTLTSGGAWGIEDDAEDDYLDEIIEQEWSALRGVLKTVGVSTDQLPLEIDRAWILWRM